MRIIIENTADHSHDRSDGPNRSIIECVGDDITCELLVRMFAGAMLGMEFHERSISSAFEVWAEDHPAHDAEVEKEEPTACM